MEIIEINTKRIEVQDEAISAIIGYKSMNVKEEIYVRNVSETKKLSSETVKLLENSRKKRLEQAIRDDDMLYIKSICNNMSILDLLKVLLQKTKKYI